jgi:hypothetical protein
LEELFVDDNTYIPLARVDDDNDDMLLWIMFSSKFDMWMKFIIYLISLWFILDKYKLTSGILLMSMTVSVCD